MASELNLPAAGVLPQEQDQEGGLRLDLLAASLRRQVLWIVGITALTASAAVLKAVTDTPTYQAGFELLTPPVTLETEIISTLSPEALSNQSDVVSITVDETQVKILKSPRLMEPIVEELQRIYPNITYAKVIRGLKISPNDTGKVLTVEYQGDTSSEVADVLEFVSTAYLRYSLEDRQNDISRGIDFVDEQLPFVKAQVDQLEANLESLRQKYNLIDPVLEGEQITQQAAAFTNEQLNLRVEIEQTEKLYQNLRQELAQGPELAATSALSQSDRYQALINQLLAVDSELAGELSLYLEGTPEIGVIEDRRENLEPLLEREGFRVQEEVASRIRELNDREQALSKNIGVLNERIKRLSTAARQYNDIQRDLEIATNNLNQFLIKREALRIDAAQRQVPWEILTPPTDPKAALANPKNNLVIGTFLGLILGSGAAILIDRMSGKIHTVKELKEVSNIPILGDIPHNPMLGDGPLPVLSAAYSTTNGLNGHSLGSNGHSQNTLPQPFSEAFRILSTNIHLSNPDNSIKALTVGSATPNSGKSTVSFYLAHTIASMGQRTLLVDADLRRPTLHKFCNLSNDKGLSSYATGEFELEDILVRSYTDENLFIITSGPVPPNPSRTLSTPRMDEFFKRVYKEFDMVIFDTPPILGFADALIVAAKTQGVLLTAGLGQAKFSELESAFGELYTAKIPIVGMVANGSKLTNDKTYQYYQYSPPETIPSFPERV